MAGEDVLSVVATLSADMRTLSSKMAELSATMQTLSFQVQSQHETLSQGGGVAVRLAVIETNMAAMRHGLAEMEQQVEANVKRADDAEARSKTNLHAALAALATAGVGAVSALAQWLVRH